MLELSLSYDLQKKKNDGNNIYFYLRLPSVPTERGKESLINKNSKPDFKKIQKKLFLKAPSKVSDVSYNWGGSENTLGSNLIWSGCTLRTSSLGQLNLFKNYLYLIGILATI